MKFEFDKFVEDIDKREKEKQEFRNNNQREIDLDRQRRLRAERYQERWQNRIVWEDR